MFGKGIIVFNKFRQSKFMRKLQLNKDIQKIFCLVKI